jgi:hypothetical protein
MGAGEIRMQPAQNRAQWQASVLAILSISFLLPGINIKFLLK